MMALIKALMKVIVARGEIIFSFLLIYIYIVREIPSLE